MHLRRKILNIFSVMNVKDMSILQINVKKLKEKVFLKGRGKGKKNV